MYTHVRCTLHTIAKTTAGDPYNTREQSSPVAEAVVGRLADLNVDLAARTARQRVVKAHGHPPVHVTDVETLETQVQRSVALPQSAQTRSENRDKCREYRSNKWSRAKTITARYVETAGRGRE